MGTSFLNKDLNKADPMLEKFTKVFSSYSIFAPKSKTSLFMPSIQFKINLETISRAPVFPADKLISASPFFCDSIDFHMLVFFPFFAAVNGLSSSSMASSQLIILQ